MADIDQYDEEAELKHSVRGIRNDWQEMYAVSSSGKKAHLTTIKKHYLRIVEADPQAAAELLGMHDLTMSLIRKYGVARLERVLEAEES